MNDPTAAGARDYASRQAIQASQYARPYHWDEARRVEAVRYARTTSLLADLATEALDRSRGRITVADVGCGDGRGTWLLVEELSRRAMDVRAVGVDVCADAVRWARERVGPLDAHARCRFVHGEAVDVLRELPDDGAPRVVVLREVMEHLEEETFALLARVIVAAPEPTALLVTVPSVNSPVSAKHLRHYSAESLTRQLESAGMAVERLTGFGFRPRSLYGPLITAKAILNGVPLLWRTMNATWREVRPAWAITLAARASRSR